MKTPHYYTTLLEIVNMVGWLNNNSHTYQANKFSTEENTHLVKKRLVLYVKIVVSYNIRFLKQICGIRIKRDSLNIPVQRGGAVP